MTTEQLETAAPEQPGATPPDQAAPSAPAPAPASTPPVDVEKIRKQAELEGYRRAQASFDKQRARELKAQQDAARARQRLEQANVRDPDLLEDYTATVQKARLYEETQAEAAQWQEWYAYRDSVAAAHLLKGDDPRLADATSAEDLTRRARAAMAEDAAAERARLLKEAADEKRRAADAAVESGALDTVAAPATPAARESDTDQFIKEMRAARGKGIDVGRRIKEKWRQKGVTVDTIQWHKQ